MADPNKDVVLERNGEKGRGQSASAEEIEKAGETIRGRGKSMDDCQCGDEMCIDGYIWSCSRNNDGDCIWYVTDWQCNEFD